MKKISILTLFLCGCVQEPEIVSYAPKITSLGPAYELKEQELSQNPDIIKTLELYTDLYGYSVHIFNFSQQEGYKPINFTRKLDDYWFSNTTDKIKIIDSGYSKYNPLEVYPQFMTFKQPNSQAYCFIQQTNTSDECILMRRNEPESKIHYFNYKKYMPKTIKLTDESFLNLVNLFIGTRPVVQKCFADTTLTTTERQTCADNVNKFLIDIANGKISKCKTKSAKTYDKEMLQGFLTEHYVAGYPWVHDQKTKNEACTNTKISERAKSEATIDIYGRVEVLYFEWNNRCVIDESALLQDRIQYNTQKEKKWCAEPYRYVNTGIVPVYIMN